MTIRLVAPNGTVTSVSSEARAAVLRLRGYTDAVSAEPVGFKPPAKRVRKAKATVVEPAADTGE